MVGKMIKEARQACKLTQEALGWAVGLSASEISRAEREEITLDNDELKRIAKAVKITQKSLLDAAKQDRESAMVSSMPIGMPGMMPMGAMDPNAPLPMGGAMPMGEPPMMLTTAEKKLMEQFRAADSATKKAVKKLLKGDQAELVELVNNGIVPGFNPMDPNAPFGGPIGGPMGGPRGRGPRF